MREEEARNGGGGDACTGRATHHQHAAAPAAPTALVALSTATTIAHAAPSVALAALTLPPSPAFATVLAFALQSIDQAQQRGLHLPRPHVRHRLPYRRRRHRRRQAHVAGRIGSQQRSQRRLR